MKIMSFVTRAAAIGLMGLGATTADAAVQLELGLAIDASGSLGISNFNLQRLAYYNVLGDEDVLPLDGSVAIGVYRFSSSVTTIYSMTVINQNTIGDLLAAINAMTYTGGNTAIAGAIVTATNDIFGNNIKSERQLIDVSTDGVNNIGNLPAARNYALNVGIDAINCIGIGRGANCNPVQAGNGSFSLYADDYDSFERSLRLKISREVAGVVPEPATWGMMIAGFGLVGFAARRRRMDRASA